MPIISIKKHTECLQFYYHDMSYNLPYDCKAASYKTALFGCQLHPFSKLNLQLVINERCLFSRAPRHCLLPLPWFPSARSVSFIVLSKHQYYFIPSSSCHLQLLQHSVLTASISTVKRKKKKLELRKFKLKS